MPNYPALKFLRALNSYLSFIYEDTNLKYPGVV